MNSEKLEQHAETFVDKAVSLHETRLGERFPADIDCSYRGDRTDAIEAFVESVEINHGEADVDNRVLLACSAFGVCRSFQISLVGADDVAQMYGVDTQEVLDNWGEIVYNTVSELGITDDPEDLLWSLGCRSLGTTAKPSERIAYTDMERVI